uniref:Uncharacterized protein n=1 Tax=Paulinella micropora TaxID=1928728 RepID=A0A385HZ90_9EUKA|nr:hypothetical protein PMNZ_006 [Paulinella micropora]AXY62972.1 hypothetical protein PMNZ_006 [Paulinella micropora]
MTRGTSLVTGLIIFLLGGLGYLGFRSIGFEHFSAGIASQAILVLVVLIWIASYLLRAMTGQMTFMEQRRRYRASYAGFTGDILQKRFEMMGPSEQEDLLKEVRQAFPD